MSLNGHLMSRNNIVAQIIEGELVNVLETFLPFYLRMHPDIEGWLEGRAVDGTRANARLLKKAPGLNGLDDASLVLYVNAATITDTHWIRTHGSNSLYKNIAFRGNSFDKLALCGDPSGLNDCYVSTPELTNIGSFEKCWRLIDGHWWLYKQENDLERFSEMFVYEFGKALGLSMAEYELDGRFIRTPDFTDGAKVNFEAAEGIVGDNEDYTFNFRSFEKLSSGVARQYVAMLYLDTLCMNMDRHTKNYGFLRDAQSGKVLSLAPLFDHNVAPLARGYPGNRWRHNDKLVELFLELLKQEPNAYRYFCALNLPTIDRSLILSCCEKIPIDVDRDFLCDFILNADRQIQKFKTQTFVCLDT